MAKDTPLQFKGTTLKVIQILLKSTHPATLKTALSKLTGDAPDFFDGEPAVLDFTGMEAFPDQVDWDGLTGLLRSAGLHPALIRGVPPAQEPGAARAGLHPLRDESFGRPSRAAPDAPAVATTAKPRPAAAQEAPKPADAPLPVSPAPTAPAAATEAPAPRTLVIDKPLRSGQRVYAKGGDLVVLAMVSAGAEVIADGNIHIYAPLRGRALAGASGDQNARIMTTCMEAELVSVAGLYRTFEQGVPREIAGQPAIVRWQSEGGQGSLVVAPLAIR